jgi:hypothetical protein
MFTRTKRSVIWKIKKTILEKVVKNKTSFADILRQFQMSADGGNARTLQKRLSEDEIDFSHIKCGRNSNKGRKRTNPSPLQIPLSKVMVKNSNYSRYNLKRRLIDGGILKNECLECGLGPEWKGLKLVLILDHINGIHNDNRRKNLRLLCPNCNSQTQTFAGRNKKYK